MSMSSREVVRRTIQFDKPDRIPYDLPPEYGTDFAGCSQNPSTEARPVSGLDEWGCLWENIGVSLCGEVKVHPLADWSGLQTLRIPDIRDPRRWQGLSVARDAAPDRFLLGSGISLYSRVHYLRGLDNTWTDIHEAPDNLGSLIDILADMNEYAIGQYAQAGADGYFFCDDWGLQDRLMISPAAWRRIWKPRYARVFKACHNAGLLAFMHSCGYTVDILDDLIEIGLDVIQMDQQENMGLDVLGSRFAGRITFWCPVDIQRTMVYEDVNGVRDYCHRLVNQLWKDGGFIAKWYNDSTGAGHKPEKVKAMAEEFMKLSAETAHRLVQERQCLWQEWHDLGFHCFCDQAAQQWQLTGTHKGLLRFSDLLRTYAANPAKKVVGEHEHYDPHFCLEIGTWSEPQITDHWIAGRPEDLARLASIVESQLRSASPGDSILLREAYAPGSSCELVLMVKEDGFDPARMS